VSRAFSSLARPEYLAEPELRRPVATALLASGFAVSPLTISFTSRRGRPSAGLVVRAYAILAGSPDGQVIPGRILIDPEGVLRSVRREGDGNVRTDPGRLLEEVRAMHTGPLTIGTGVEHEHHD